MMERERASAPKEIFEASQDIRFLIPVLTSKFDSATRVGYTLPYRLLSPYVFKFSFKFINGLQLRCVNVPTVENTAWIVYVGGAVLTYMKFFFFSFPRPLKRRRTRRTCTTRKISSKSHYGHRMSPHAPFLFPQGYIPWSPVCPGSRALEHDH